MDEVKQTTIADIEAMSDADLIQEAKMIQMAYRTINPGSLTRMQSLRLFCLAVNVSAEIKTRKLEMPTDDSRLTFKSTNHGS